MPLATEVVMCATAFFEILAMVGRSSAGIFPNRSAKVMMPLTKSWTSPEAFSEGRLSAVVEMAVEMDLMAAISSVVYLSVVEHEHLSSVYGIIVGRGWTSVYGGG